jgi:hypothetical protein
MLSSSAAVVPTVLAARAGCKFPVVRWQAATTFVVVPRAAAASSAQSTADGGATAVAIGDVQ